MGTSKGNGNGGWQSTSYPGIYFRLNRKGEKIYGVDFKDADGIRRRERVPGHDNLAEAKEKQGELRGSKQPVKRGNDRLGEYAETVLMQRTGVDEETRRINLRHLRDHVPSWLKQRKLWEIGAGDIHRMLDEHERKGLSISTSDSVRYMVSTVLNQAVIDKGLPMNVCRSVKRKRNGQTDRRVRREELFSHEEIRKLLNAVEGIERLILEMLIYTGLRVSELGGLVWADVDLEAGVLHVRQQLTAVNDERDELKTLSSVRDVVLSSSLVAGLRAHRREAFLRGESAGFVFLTPAGRAWSRNRLWRLVTGSCDEAGVRRRKPHYCRHTFASMLLSDPSVDIYYVKEQLGHSQVTLTLDVYGHLYQHERKAELGRAALDSFA
jgi:integrase